MRGPPAGRLPPGRDRGLTADGPGGHHGPAPRAAAWLAPGESGAVSVITGLVVIGIIFQSLNGHFLSPVNLTDLLIQGAVFMLLGMSEVFALLLGDIDLSIGFVSGIGGVITAELLIGSRNWPWWAAVITALLVTTAIGAAQGTLIARLRLPSFVVTLAGLLACQGVMIWILGSGGTLPISDNVINDLANGCLTPPASWLLMAAIVAAFAVVTIRRDAERRAGGAPAAARRPAGPPPRLAPPPPPASSSWRCATPTAACSARSAACRGWCSSSWASCSPGRSCSTGPGSAGTCTRSAATRKLPGGPGSAWPGSGPSPSPWPA